MIKLQKLTQEAEKKFIKLCEERKTEFNINEFKTQGILDVEIDAHKEFNNKFSLGKYLYEKLKGIQVENKLWHFLTIIYHKQLLKNEGIGEVDRFYINPNKSFYPFTHLLKPVFDLYNFYSNDPELIKFFTMKKIKL